MHRLIATQALQSAAHAAEVESSATKSHSTLVRKRSARLLKAFARANLTGDGKLSTVELARLLPERVARHLGEAGTAALLKRHDRNKSGTIDVAELAPLMREVNVLQARLAADDEEHAAAAEANRAHRAAKAAASAAKATRARDAALTVQRTWRAVQHAHGETRRIACRCIQQEWRAARAMRARDAAATTIVRFFFFASFVRREIRAATVIIHDMVTVTALISARATEAGECRKLRARIRAFNDADAVAARRARVAWNAAREERVREERWQCVASASPRVLRPTASMRLPVPSARAPPSSQSEALASASGESPRAGRHPCRPNTASPVRRPFSLAGTTSYTRGA